MRDCFYSFCRLPSSTSRNQDFLFCQLFFLYFSLNKDHKRWKHKNFHLKQRWDVAYTNQERFLKIWKQLRSLKTLCLCIQLGSLKTLCLCMFVNFFGISEFGLKWHCQFIICAKFCHLSAVKSNHELIRLKRFISC